MILISKRRGDREDDSKHFYQSLVLLALCRIFPISRFCLKFEADCVIFEGWDQNRNFQYFEGSF